MNNPTRITQTLLDAVKIADSNTLLDRLLVPTLVIIGVGYTSLQIFLRDFAEAGFFAASVMLLVLLSAVRPVQRSVMGQPFNRRHAAHTILFWLYGVLWINLIQLFSGVSIDGKGSGSQAAILITIIAITIMMLRSLLIFTKRFYGVFSTTIPIWEQFLLAVNEIVAILLLAGFASAHLMTLIRPDVFTIRTNPIYLISLSAVLIMYYGGMQLMWIQRANDWLSRNSIWIRLARFVAPVSLIAISLMIAQRLIQRADIRTATLTGNQASTLAVLAIAPIVWLILLVILILVFTSSRGLRQRFLPDILFDWIPRRLTNVLRSISDMDILLILVALATLIPTYLLVMGGGGSTISVLQAQIVRGGGGLIESAEQALSILFTAPFYLLIVALLTLYGYALSRPNLSAHERDELVERLPIGFLIILAITLYLFAVPFSQVFIEGRLPQIPQDLGRILAFNVVIPLVLLYAHYAILIRIPYGRGQSRWREIQGTRLNDNLRMVDQRLDDVNRQLQQLDRAWQEVRSGQSLMNLTQNFDLLFRYVQLNNLRDDINMQRLRILTDRQQLAEVSEAPVSLALARLPIRVVSFGIPLLLAIQIYQWAVVNNGLREIIENPNLTIFDFFRAILQQTQF